MNFFQRMASAVLGQDHHNESNMDHYAGLCIADESSDMTPAKMDYAVNCYNDGNNQRKGDLSASFLALKKGQRITLPSGKQLTVKEFDDNWCWCNDSSLPVFRGCIQ